MEWDSLARFKIGDLVKIIERVDFIVYSLIIQPGEIGLVVAVEWDHEIYSVWGVDYIVLVRGVPLVFFDCELAPFPSKQTDSEFNKVNH